MSHRITASGAEFLLLLAEMPARVGPFEREPELDDVPPDDSPRSSSPFVCTRPCRDGYGCRRTEGVDADADLPRCRPDDLHRRLRTGASRRTASGERPDGGQEDAGGRGRAREGQV